MRYFEHLPCFSLFPLPPDSLPFGGSSLLDGDLDALSISAAAATAAAAAARAQSVEWP